MKRRGFFATLGAAAVAPKALSKEKQPRKAVVCIGRPTKKDTDGRLDKVKR